MNISLKYKFLIPTVLILILGMGTVSIVSHIKAEQALRQVIVDEVDHISKATVKSMSAWLNERVTDLGNWSRQGVYSKALQNSYLGLTARTFANDRLDRIKSDYGYYKSIFLADISGKIVASSEPDRVGSFNVSDRIYFKKSMEGRIHVTQAALKSKVDGERVVVVSAPVMEDGKVLGVLFAVFDVNSLAARFIDGISVGENGIAYIFTDDGYTVCNNKCLQLSGKNIHNFDFGREMAEKKSGILEYSLDGQKKMTAFFKRIDALNWTIVISAVNDEIMMPVKNLGRINAAVTAAVLFVVTVVIGLVTLSISRPIREVVQGLNQMGGGDLSYRIDLKSQDEIGQIGHALNRLAQNFEKSEQKIKEQNKQLIRARDDLELRVEQRTYALRQAEKKYRGIFENAVEGIFQVTPQGYILSANPSFAGILGYASVAELFAGEKPVLFPVSRTQGQKIISELDLKGKIVAYETQVKRKNGERFWASVSVSRIHNEENNSTYFEGFVIDISERREKDKALREYKAAQAANRAKSEFIANMSHEIRTPLNTLLGFSELLAADLKNPRHETYIDAMRLAGNSLLTLINDILDLSKIEAGKMVLNREPVNFRTLCSEISYIFKEKIEEKAIRMLIDLPVDFPKTVYLDETRMRQILLNLVGNAVKFTDEGTVSLTVRTEVCEEKDSVDLVITVSDTGPGIDPLHQEIIFESFRQVNGQINRKHGGTGLGLAICKRLTEAMNGRIDVKSMTGEGSTFEVILKQVGFGDAPSVVDVEIPENRNLASVKYEKAKVLVVDDTDSNRVMLKELLIKYNFDVAEAVNGLQAVETARTDPPDLIIMDMRMPVLDGNAATKTLKNDSKTRHIPIIAFTGDVVSRTKDGAISQGYDGYLTKPVKLGELNHELAKYFAVQSQEKTPENNAEIDWDEFSKEQIHSPHDFYKALENTINPWAERLKGSIVINQIKMFGEELRTLAEKHRVQPLMAFSRQLNDSVDMFDIIGIEKQMELLPGLLEKLINPDSASGSQAS